MTLILVSFLAGILTVLAPCVLPVLPVILAGSLSEKQKWYPYLVTFSLAVSVVLFTVLLKVSTAFIDIPSSFWKYLSGGILLGLGLVYIFPHGWAWIAEKAKFSRSNNSLDTAQNIGNPVLRAIVTGAVLGPVFSTCSPTYSLLLATVFPVSVVAGIGYTFVYAIGLSMMLVLIALGGRSIVSRFRGVADERGMFKKILGFIFLIVGITIITGFDKTIETKVIEKFDISQVEQSILEKFITPKENKVPVEETKNENTSLKLNVVNPYPAPEIALTEWINSHPLTMKDLRGKVVIIDFWTYSCINCQRTLPYLVKWDKKYRDKGLVIIGVHAPEFSFEKKRENVEKASKDADITYPVVLDNDFALWSAYKNHYWPAKYFIDKEWKVRHTHFGEGAYAESEKVIQQLLSEGTSTEIDIPVDADVSLSGKQNQSPETYLGSLRAKYFSQTSKLINGVHEYGYTKEFYADEDTNPNKWEMYGKWKTTSEYQESVGNGGLRIRVSGKQVFLVMSGEKGKKVVVSFCRSTKERVSNPCSLSKGKDLQYGQVTLDSDRLYEVVNESVPFKNATLELRVDSGVQLHAFTFGSH